MDNQRCKLSNKLVIPWVALCLILLSSSIFHHSYYWELGSIFSVLTTLTIYQLYTNGVALHKYRFIFIAIICIFLYSMFTSLFVSRSTFIALNLLSSFLFFCSIIDVRADNLSADTLTGKQRLKLLEIVVLVVVLTHACYLVYQYIQLPIRVTGLLKDYSQASMCILIGFGLFYPHINKSKFGLLLVFILFLGFFAPVSRTANFLLLVFMSLLATYEYRHNNIRFFATISSIIIVALVCVYLYPFLVDSLPVDRGGLSKLSTLNSRTLYWDAAWEAIKQRPFLGYGLGNFEWSGIKTIRPFEYTPSVHNDYLQIWLDLGFAWFCLIIGSQLFFLSKTIPLKLQRFRLTVTTSSIEYYISWALLFCVSLYMLINFIVSFLFFQLLIAILISEIVLNEKTQTSQ